MPTALNKLCLSLLPTSEKELHEWLKTPLDADILEIRTDHLPELDISALRGQISIPLITTLRSSAEGGFFAGSHQESIRSVQNAIDAGSDYVDIEFSQAEHILPKLKMNDKTKVVLSVHTAETQLVVLSSLLTAMLATAADVYKIVFHANHLNDCITAFKLIEEAQALGIKFVIHAMGDHGKNSRLIGAFMGNEWTYIAHAVDKTTAIGQLTTLEAETFYHLRQKKRHTRILGLIGSPIQQSKGWRLHNRLIANHVSSPAKNSDDYIYLNFEVSNFDEFWSVWKDRLHGLSVTLPHKETVMEQLHDFSPEVRISGVCNTMVRTSEGWYGYNTDFLALQSLLSPHKKRLENGGLVIGTGATARSAIAALKRLEISPIFMVGRNEERGNDLAKRMGVDFLMESEVHYAGVSGVVQTTPVGMMPYTDKYPIGTSHFRKGRLVLDVIYNPPVTRFLQIAEERGCEIISGLEMFLLQAARQFELFTGKTVTNDEVRKAWRKIA